VTYVSNEISHISTVELGKSKQQVSKYANGGFKVQGSSVDNMTHNSVFLSGQQRTLRLVLNQAVASHRSIKNDNTHKPKHNNSISNFSCDDPSDTTPTPTEGSARGQSWANGAEVPNTNCLACAGTFEVLVLR
jgi:hypothetical protein